jgi:hypothetical protein
MAKFAVKDPNDDDTPIKPSHDEVLAMNGIPPEPPIRPIPQITQPMAAVPTPQPIPVITVGDTGSGSSIMSQQTVQTQSIQATAQAQSQVGLAQAAIDNKIVDEQIKKEEEHWVKSYWRPAMGWLYMAICLMDFIGFPFISMFLPIIFKHDGIAVNYVAWQSLSLSNGGLIHLAFGAILGVSAWTRGQEKIAKI